MIYHLETNIKSPTSKFGFIDPDGMLKGSKKKERIKIAINIAKKIDFKLFNKELKNFITFKNNYICNCIVFFITQ